MRVRVKEGEDETTVHMFLRNNEDGVSVDVCVEDGNNPENPWVAVNIGPTGVSRYKDFGGRPETEGFLCGVKDELLDRGLAK